MDAPKPKHRLRTLCTIDTSDIELNDFRHPKPARRTPALDPTSHSRTRSKATPTSFTPLHAKKHSSPSKSRTKRFSRTMQKSRVKTEYSGDGLMKTLQNKSMGRAESNPFFKTGGLRKKMLFPFDEQYRTDAYEFVRDIDKNKQEQVSLVKKDGVLYLLKKSRDKKVKKEYEREELIRPKITAMKSRNLLKLHRSYHEKTWMYMVYEYPGERLSWDNPLHRQVIGKSLKDNGAVLINYITETARAIHELSSKGWVHGGLRLESTYWRIEETPNRVKVQGNIKVGDFSQCFHIRNKCQFLKLPDTIYTAPEIINYKIFQKKEKFDRKLIEYISIEDQAWYVDIWSLGIISLELIAGEPINLQKVTNRNLISSEEVSLEGSMVGHSPEQIVLLDDEITLVDILLAQKNLLLQTEQQMSAIGFNRKLQEMVVRMLSVNPLDRPSPKQIMRELGH